VMTTANIRKSMAANDGNNVDNQSEEARCM
jgi:hypothetical protein